MNNEDEESQRNLTYACYRQFDLLMEDLNFMLQCVRDKGVRPWIWGHIAAKDFERFENNIGKDVLVSPYYVNHMYSDPQAPLIDAPDHVNMTVLQKSATAARILVRQSAPFSLLLKLVLSAAWQRCSLTALE